MDQGLVAWARRVKQQHPGAVPLWLFTDEARLPAPKRVISRLPPGLCGVVLRQDAHPDRLTLAKDIARLCRRRRLALVVAGDARLAKQLGAGVHMRGGAAGRPTGWFGGLLSASVHNESQVRQARRAKARLMFISPVFATRSHPGAAVLGWAGWRRLALQAGPATPCALGGITHRTLRHLGPFCKGIGGIEAFL